MSTILVLTDFSINADYAAHYALKLAQRIEANLLVCNIYELPQDEHVTNARPLPANEENSIQDLGEICARLKTALYKDKEGLFRPEVDRYSLDSTVAGRLNDVAIKKKVIMAVICTHNANWLSALLPGNGTDDIIEAANFPVMLIPYRARFSPYKLIAFAATSNYTDINILESLTGLAKYTNAEVLVAHVTPEDSDESKELAALKSFFGQLSGKLNYPGILYRILKNKQVVAGLMWMMTYVDIDLLVVVGRGQNNFRKSIESSVTQQLAKSLHKPLLIFPCVTLTGTNTAI